MEAATIAIGNRVQEHLEIEKKSKFEIDLHFTSSVLFINAQIHIVYVLLAIAIVSGLSLLIGLQ